MSQAPGNIPLSLSTALTKARREFASADPAVLAGRSLAEFRPTATGGGELELAYFGDHYTVSHPTGRVTVADGAGPAVPVITQVLLFHYLLNATGVAPAGRWVTYRELPQGDTYERAFRQRVIAPLETAFGYDLDRFVAAGLAAGGERARLGDASFYFRVLPRVPLMVILWTGDDEVPPGVNVVFDAAAGAYLPGEDLAYVGIAMAGRLLGAGRGALLT